MSRHIALIIHALHGGGAERVAATMANQWVAGGDRVTVITLDTVGSDVYRVNSQVRRIGLGLMKTSRSKLEAIWNNRRRIRTLRRVIREVKPDCVVSVTDRMNIVTLLACRGLPVPVVIAEHSDPRHQQLGVIWEPLRRRTYRHAAAIVVLTHAVAEYLRGVVGERPIYVVPNGIAPPADSVAALRESSEPLIVAMGRLSAEKGFDTLIDAFAAVATEHPQWQLEIAGEGQLRNALQKRIDQCGLSERIRLIGWVEDPATFLARAAMFVLSSRYEGFPVSLLEAMALGLAVVSFDCDSGPREIIRHQEDGLLVPASDGQQLAEAMVRLIDDASLRQRLGKAASGVVERFSPERFARQWEEVLQNVLHPPGSCDTSQQS